MSITYRSFFLYALCAVSLLPAATAFLNFGITDQPAAGLVLLLSLVTFLSNSHQTVTIAFYVSRRWRSFFDKRPLVFYVAPAIILVASISLVLQPNRQIGWAFVVLALFANLWHHAKQNWGILSLISANRGVKTPNLQNLLVYAWIIAIPPLCLMFPGLSNTIGAKFLYDASVALAAFYLMIAAWIILRRLSTQDPVVWCASIILVCYFLPLTFLSGKPYALLVFATAHGMQYYLLVFLAITMGERRQLKAASIACGVGLTVFVIACIALTTYAMRMYYAPPDLWDSVLVRLVVGLLTGTAFMHFWVDAFIWRFSDSQVRNAHGDAFAF